MSESAMRRFFTGFHADFPVTEVEEIAFLGLPVEVDGDALASLRQPSAPVVESGRRFRKGGA